MDTKKIIILNITIFALIVNILYLFLQSSTIGAGFINFLKNTYVPLGIIAILLIIDTFIFLSFEKGRVLIKKNLLKISLIFSIILFIGSIIARIYELYLSVFCIACWINSLLYLILVIIIILMLKDLHKLVEKLFNNNY